MTTLSIPVNAELEAFVEKMVKTGKGTNRADVVRKALEFWKEDMAIQAVLKAQSEPDLKGDIRDLMKRLA